MKPVLAFAVCVAFAGCGPSISVTSCSDSSSSSSNGTATVCTSTYDCTQGTTRTQFKVSCTGKPGNYACDCIQTGAVVKSYTSIDFCESSDRKKQAETACGFKLQ